MRFFLNLVIILGGLNARVGDTSPTLIPNYINNLLRILTFFHIV